MTTTTRPRSMREIREANPEWFSPSAMRFFRCRVSAAVYGDGYFVTSERGPDEIRRYTVRHALPGGGIETVGEFGEFATSAAAHRAARRTAWLFRPLASDAAKPAPCVNVGNSYGARSPMFGGGYYPS